ncbi:MAG TPA: septum formation initiator family protein [Novosphingobium sp.]|nr:septum formation initiator family protein [Novosphingobium sp.]HZV08424.1 septum formation initiator family protein [Novosphingobium sp.]
MQTLRSPHRLLRESLVQGVALCCLLVMLALAVAGPSGLLAWQENRHDLTLRQQQIAQLTHQRDQLKNRVALLDPRHADPDLAGELLRRNLGVAHPDEMIIIVH